MTLDPCPVAEDLPAGGESVERAVGSRPADARLRQLRRVRKQARRDDVHEVVSTLAHRVNQPLNALVAYAEAARRLLQATEPDRHRLDRVLDCLQQQALRAGAELRGLLVNCVPAPPLQCVQCLGEAVHDAVDSHRDLLRAHGILLLLDVPAHMPDVCVDGGQVARLLSVLFDNVIDAFEHQAAHGRRRVEPGRVTLRIIDRGPDVLLRVEDNGPGIAPADLARVFDPLYTTRPAALGLGLATARALAQANGGRLWLEPAANPPARGLCACLLLPKATPHLAGPGAGAQGPSSA